MKGTVKDLPKKIMRPVPHDAAKAEYVWPRKELIAALQKAGVKKATYSAGRGTSDSWEKQQRTRQANERRKKAILTEICAPITAVARKRNAKIPWGLLLGNLLGDWQANKVIQRLGWGSKYDGAAELLQKKVDKMPENQMAGIVVDILITRAVEDQLPKGKLEELGKFYGVDVAAVEKEARKKFAPPSVKKAKVQTAGKNTKKAKVEGGRRKAKGKK